MDSFPQHPNPYMRPSAPQTMMDPNFAYHHQPPPPSQRPPQPPVPPQGSSWYSGQFHYHPSHSHSPSPPPPQQQPWGSLPPAPAPPQPHSDHLASYPPHYAHPQGQYPPPQLPPRPQMAPPPPYSHAQAYPGGNKEWGTTNYPPQSGWEHPTSVNEEDWAAKAKAWAAARAAMENQHPSLQAQHPSHHHPPTESHYQNNQQTSVPMPHPSYENYPVPSGASMNKQPHLAHQADTNSYHGQDRSFPDAGVTYPQQEGFVTPSVHKQEVPSSYSPAPGKHDAKEEYKYAASSVGGSSFADQTYFSYGNLPGHGQGDPRDQPLEFTPRFNPGNPQLQPGYSDSAASNRGMDSVGALPTFQPWTQSVASNLTFPSLPPTFPAASQDPSVTMLPLTGQPSAMLGRVPGPNPNFAPVSSATSIAGTAIHPATTFPGDLYGAFSVERPKKAAVPDWLRDEIIKNRDVITSSGVDHLKEDSVSLEDGPIDKPIGKSDQADSKSVDSSRSTEEEEDEDEIEAARSAMINHEIKRILTEVLLKVTTDLFDEIATRVLSEDDPPLEGNSDDGTHVPVEKLLSPPAVSTAKTSAKVVIPAKSKEYKTEDNGEKSSSGAAGNLLGLANYSSSDEDEDEDDEIRSSNATKPGNRSATISSSSKKHEEENHHEIWNGRSASRMEEPGKIPWENAGRDNNIKSHEMHDVLSAPTVGQKMDDGSADCSRSPILIGRNNDIHADHGRAAEFPKAGKAERTGVKLTGNRIEGPVEDVKRSSKNDFAEKDSRRYHRHEMKSNSSRREPSEEPDYRRKKESGDEKGEIPTRSRERSKVFDHGEKSLEVDSGKFSPYHESSRSKQELNRHKKTSDKEDTRRKRERSKDDKDDKYRHKHSSDSRRSKSRRSSSISGKDKHNKTRSPVDPSDDSTDEALEDSRRKGRSERETRSPSPDRSRERQVSRSPPSRKVSQRRHSPYSSLDSSRRKRSRSRSPTRRRR